MPCAFERPGNGAGGVTVSARRQAGDGRLRGAAAAEQPGGFEATLEEGMMAAAPRKGAGSAASVRADHLYPVDVKVEKPEALEAAAQAYYAKLLEEPSPASEFFSIPGREKVKLEASLMRFLPLYKENSKHTLLVLNDPQDKYTVLAIYLHHSWWFIEDVVKTDDHSCDGLKQVQTFGERIVLFVLNFIIFGMLERSLTHDVLFVPHSENECAKIFWRRGDAAAFYTVKVKGTLCDGHTSQCYLLPVLDTMFVRKKFRRHGLALKMLHDFCQTFAAEDALGLSCPVSADMYQVCRRFFAIHPEEQSRLWEVEAPGDWSQRASIWLKIQLEQNLQEKLDVSCHMKRFQEDEPGQSDEGQMKKSIAHIPKTASPGEGKKCKDDPEEAVNLWPHGEEHVQHQAKKQQCKGSKKRASGGEPAEGRVPKQFRVTS
ncbi:protein FAM169B-like isoform X2 [Rhineura floridana]|uniref:protein FAM169B-like isoform X2 n=1 Tax=Rhineura floridana TaxID=261503 RepID=UPI002AC80242|nr:protein FAM169B-like isoform X2 [Rhineura floridana]